MKPIVTLCDKGWAGVQRACQHLQRNSGLTRHLTLTHADPLGAEATFLLEHLREHPPQILLFCGSWNPVYERFARELEGRTRLGFWFHSSGGQLGLSGELAGWMRLLDDRRLAVRLCTSPALTAFAGVRLLPNTFAPVRRADREPTSIPALCLFCGPDEHGRKNVVNCLLALARVQRPFVLHLNTRVFHDVLEALAIPCVEHDWIPEDELDSLLEQMDLGLQVSFCESFGYFVPELLLRGIPVLASAMVPSLDLLPADLRAALSVERADDPLCIAAGVERLLKNGRELARRARPALLRGNRKAVQQVRATLTGLLE